MAKAGLRAVGEDERPAAPTPPPTLLEAIESGDVLDMLLAQRRLLAGSLADAAASVRPQLNNELNKLHTLIREEQVRREAHREASDDAPAADEAFDASAI